MKIFTVISLLLALLLGCKSTESVLEIKKGNYHLGTPPGTVEIDNGFYLDQAEISNHNWLEYIYWNKRVFGKNSEEYRGSLPDTSVWVKFDTSFATFTKHYLRHIAYSKYPVVGISYDQAQRYSKWRTDRVFEQILVKQGIIEYDSLQNDTNFFTLEKFYINEKHIADHDIPYPEYKLLPPEKWTLIIQKSDSINEQNIKSCSQKSFLYRFGTKPVYCTELIENRSLIINSIDIHEKGLKTVEPLRETYCYTCRKPVVFHMIGNVREITSDKNIILGGGWIDSINNDRNITAKNDDNPNCWTGFRNVCKWKKYK